jgi:hypothetical protein
LICHIFCNQILLFITGPKTLSRDHSIASYKTPCALTCDLLSINIVPRHSYNSTNFVPGRQKMRHASFIPVGKGTLTRCSNTAPTSIHSATQTPFIAGPLGLREVPTNRDCQRIKARVWQPSITTINAATKHMLFS